MSKLSQARNKNRSAMAFVAVGAGFVGMNAMSIISADTVDQGQVNEQDKGQPMTLKPNVTAGSFDLTKQASGELYFPVQFDRPSGINAAALAGTVIQLGADSKLYKSCVAAVPDLANTTKMNSLLSDALDKSSPNYASARENIVKLINWYNSLGGQKIQTQSGEAYTAKNLDSPINVLAVAFSDANSINAAATSTLASINSSKTVEDVEKALEGHKSGITQGYKSAFDAYAKKIYAPNANVNELSSYTALKPVLDAYQDMYAQGASNIRTTLLNGAANSTEAGVTFFESAVIAGSTSNNGGDGSEGNTPSDSFNYTTKWVDDHGRTIAPSESSKTGYGNQKTIDGYTFKETSTDDSTHTKTYTYTKNDTPTPDKPTPEVTADTVWVDESGNTLKEKESGTKPDNDGKSDIPGYVVVSVNTSQDDKGNTHTVNTYHKVVSDTTWVDGDGNTLKDKTDGEHPDNDGESDIPGYDLVTTKKVTDKNGDTHIINTYTKTPDKEQTPDTYWFDTEGHTLKEKAVGQTLPDNDGKSDIPGYTLKQTHVVSEADLAEGGVFHNAGFKVNDVINIYEKTPAADTVYTDWVDGDGNTLKPREDGAKPDNDGQSDIPGYDLVRTTTDEHGNVTNTYRKSDEPKKVTTNWVNEDGDKLKPEEDGSHPDNDGKSDIDGYTLIHTNTDADGNVTNVYHKIQTNWVDETGKKLQDSKDGSFPDNDGKSDITGYEFVKTTIDPKTGDVTNIYRPVTAPVVTSWVDKDGNRLTPDVSDKDFGKEKSFKGYTLKDVRMSDDGKHKFYIYEKTPDAPQPNAPQTPTPNKPAAPAPSAPSAKTIPQTGVDNTSTNAAAVAGAGILGALGLSGLASKRRKNLKKDKS